jgi:hypothetical protein
MSLPKANHKLRRDLKEAAALLKWSGVDLIQAAVRLSKARREDEARELLKIAASYQEVEDRVAGCVDEVGAGSTVRGY